MTKKVYVALDGTEFSTKEDAMEYQELSNNSHDEFVQKRKEFLVLKEAASQAEEAVCKFQLNCIHEYVKIQPRSDTGNYDRSQDSYWYVIECKCCEKRWNEDQSTSKYSDFNNKNIEWIK